jgi:hypothetical protein
MRLLLVAAALMAFACGGDSADPRKTVTPTSDPSVRLQRLDYDSNSNGKPDVHTYMEGNRAVRSEIDANEDGVIDRWEYYDDRRQVIRIGMSSAGDNTVDTATATEPARIERSSQRDDVIDRREFVEGDEVIRAEEDSDRDGRMDRWEGYKDGVLVTLALDTTGQLGRPDRRLVYGDNGDVVRVEVDPDGDGVFSPVPAGGRS